MKALKYILFLKYAFISVIFFLSLSYLNLTWIVLSKKEEISVPALNPAFALPYKDLANILFAPGRRLEVSRVTVPTSWK